MKQKNTKVKVLGSIGNFQIFNDAENGDHIILLLGKGFAQFEYPVSVDPNKIDKVMKKYYSGKEISIPTEYVESFM